MTKALPSMLDTADILRGNVSGEAYLHKFGRNPAINILSNFEAVWNGGGPYTGFDAVVAETLDIRSDDAADAGALLSSGTATGGSYLTLEDSGADFVVTDGVSVGDLLINDSMSDHGVITAVTATQITVRRMDFAAINTLGDSYRIATATSTGAAVVLCTTLLDGVYAQSVEHVILNGTTGVDTMGTYLRHARMRCVLAGSNDSNVGELTSRQKTTTANIFAVMPAGYNSTMIAAATIPAGKTGFLYYWFAALSGKVNADCNVKLRMRPVGELFQVQEERAILGAGKSGFHIPFAVPKGPYPEMSDVFIEADTDTNNTALAAGFGLSLSDGVR